MAEVVLTSYDAVILAAGRNTRLRGVVPSYHKPLMIVNGRPLIVTLVKRALSWCGNAIVVVSPQNCQAIGEVLADNCLDDPRRVKIVVQPTARGPGEGLLRALVCGRGDRTLLLLGDNIIPDADYAAVFDSEALTVKRMSAEDAAKSLTISVALTSDEEDARRFTRVDQGETLLTLIEGVDGGRWLDGQFRCWIGPMIFDRVEAYNALCKAASYWYNDQSLDHAAGEVKISGPLATIKDLDVHVVIGHSVDVGTSDALMQLYGE